MTSVAGKTGAVTLAAGDIAGTAWTEASLTNNNQLANGSNFAVRGEGVSEFANNAGYLTSVPPFVPGYGAVGSYTYVYNGNGDYGSPGWAVDGVPGVGNTTAVFGLSGSWMQMGGEDGQGITLAIRVS